MPAMQQSKAVKTDKMKTVIVQFNHGELELPIGALDECYHRGNCDNDVEHWHDIIDWSTQMPDEQIRKELEEYGAWNDDELGDVVENRKRILWIAAGNYQDENQ